VNHSEPLFMQRLGLTKLYLWPEAERFQAYPQALARLATYPELRQGATRRQIGEQLFRLAYVRGRKPLRENVLTNCFGVVQVAESKLVIRGINLFRRREPAQPRQVPGSPLVQWETQDDLWVPTAEAIALGEAYTDDPDGLRWQQLLAEQLGRYEVRTRLFLGLLAEGRRVVFAGRGFFAGPNHLAQLVGGQEEVPLFAESGAALNMLLKERISHALGPWWHAEIAAQGYTLAHDFVLEGVHNGPPSTNKLSYNLRNGLAVFKALGVLADLDDGWGLDEAAAVRHLSSELVADLVGTTPALVRDPYEALRRAVDELADEVGFVIVTSLARRWAELQGLPPAEIDTRFDDFVRRGLYEGIVQVLDSHPGQPRMGRGLLGDNDRRRVRLSISVRATEGLSP